MWHIRIRELSESQGGMFSTVIKIWLRHDCLRPASWVSLGLAGCAAFATASETGLPLVGWGILTAAVAIGIGEVPASLPLWSFQVRARRWAYGGFTRSSSGLPHGIYWQLVRLVWPSTGYVAGLVITSILWSSNPAEQLPWLIGGGGTVVVLTAGTLSAFLVSGFLIADAYSGTLLTGWTAITLVRLSFLFLPPWFVWTTPFVLMVEWICVGLGFLLTTDFFSVDYSESFGSILLRNDAAAPTHKEDVFSSIGFLGILPVRSKWRRSVRIISIAILLVAMVGWLLLTTSAIPRYEILASIVFGAIAIPAASLLDGYRVVSNWDYLVPRKKRVRWLEIATTPNRISQAGIVLVSYGAIILWPPLVVSLATVGNPGVASALQAAGFLAVNGVTTMMACLVLQRAMARSETVFAFSLSVWVVGVWILVPACPSLP